jgi:hypothetical protein
MGSIYFFFLSMMTAIPVTTAIPATARIYGKAGCAPVVLLSEPPATLPGLFVSADAAADCCAADGWTAVGAAEGVCDGC